LNLATTTNTKVQLRAKSVAKTAEHIYWQNCSDQNHPHILWSPCSSYKDTCGRVDRILRRSASPYAKVCNLDSQAAAMRIVPAIKMHNDFEEVDIVHRERLPDGLSLDLALLSKIIVQFDSSISDKL
jgi:hypothetical protein